MRRGFATSILLACAITGSAQSSNSPASAESANVFRRLREEWASHLRQKQIEASVEMFAPDADFLPPDGTRIHGTAELRKLYQSVTAAFDSDLIFDSSRVEISGDLAYDTGSYREQLTERTTNKPHMLTGTYLTIYRRDSANHWRIVEQAWTVSGTPSPAP